MREEFLWTERYRPRTVDDTILPDRIKAPFRKFVAEGNIPNLLLSGPAGVGKTTIAMAMLDEMGCDYIVINGSMNGNIDTLRNEIKAFASSMSLTGGRKYVILDEADYLNANSTQPALRNFMEEYSKNCGFILTCNFKSRIIAPISESRIAEVNFKFKKAEMPDLATHFFRRACKILDAEKIDYDKAAVAEVIKKFGPDWRRCLNEMQFYSASGKIDAGILTSMSDESFRSAIKMMKERDFTNLRRWVAENSDVDTAVLYRALYDAASSYMDPKTIPMMVMIIAKYQYQAAFVADQEINTMACLTEIMIECVFL